VILGSKSPDENRKARFEERFFSKNHSILFYNHRGCKEPIRWSGSIPQVFFPVSPKNGKENMHAEGDYMRARAENRRLFPVLWKYLFQGTSLDPRDKS